MKTSTLLLIVSLVANGALIAGVALRSPAAARPSSSVAPAGAAPVVTPSAQAAKVPVANLWSRLHAGNYDEFRDRLRAAGFPAKAVRMMLNMAISDESKERRDAILEKWEDIPYWKDISARYGNLAPEQQTQLQQIYRESDELIQKYANTPELLAEDESERDAYKRRFGDLPVEKLQQLMLLERTLQKKQRDIFAKYSSSGRAPDAEAMRAMNEAQQALERERVAEVAQVLSPAELEQYELRNSPLSAGLRNQLATFRPTEAEFKALFALQKNMPSGDRDQFMAQAQAALGADRYAEYAVTMTSDGQGKLGQLISRLELPLTTITTINGVRDDIRQRAQIISDDKSLSADVRAAQLATLAQEANERLTSTLGKRGFEAYADLKGEWIRALKPRK